MHASRLSSHLDHTWGALTNVEEEKEKTMEANSWKDLEGQTKGPTVSGDGTWRKRRFNYLQGVSTVIAYYRLAIRRNSDSVEKIKDAYGPPFFTNLLRMKSLIMCPPGQES
ncbi:hypothetical protein J437_LFUL008945 [Ladona fulva]|uniref:Uncharacterized protein n=1 Tax=Ladona fulva TaxID=123851 RepID=A0A8K0P4V1_LADFU|nr:hypothetical protein J437_LFUL008945 [Ladona fulva]